MTHPTKDLDFAYWAFGVNTWDIFLIGGLDPLDLMQSWNRLHGDLLMLKGDGNLREDLKKIQQLYEEHKNGKEAKGQDNESVTD